MHKRLIVPLVLAFALASTPAHASTHHRALYVGVLSVLGAVVLGCLAGGAALYLEAPHADTLMDYKREASASDTLFVAGGVAVLPTAIFAALGGAFLSFGKDTHVPVSLVPSRSGAGIAVAF